jgi:predicted aminopeptidase
LISYLIGAAAGHCRLMLARRPIRSLIESHNTPRELRDKLAFVLEVRDFATAVLGLPDNGSYRCYAELDRDAAVWTVFAAPEFSIEPVVWRYPVIGSMVYRAYPTRDAAERFAARLRHHGNDTYIHGSVAYSTLGWFDDPVLSTFINWPNHRLAALVFHELAHQKAFVRSDSFFNEAFAVAVEREGVRRLYTSLGAAEEERRQADAERHQLLEARTKLAALYATALPPDEKRRQKAALGFNNAYLVRAATYYSYSPAFEALLTNCRGDLTKFYARVSELARLPNPTARREALTRELPRNTPPAT